MKKIKENDIYQVGATWFKCLYVGVRTITGRELNTIAPTVEHRLTEIETVYKSKTIKV